MLQLIATVEELQDENEQVDDVQVEIDGGHDVVIWAQAVVNHVCVWQSVAKLVSLPCVLTRPCRRWRHRVSE